MKRFFLLAILMLATFASAQQADSTDILIYIGKKDTTQSGRWRPGMGVIIREATDIWGRKEMSLEDSLFVRLRVGVTKSRIDSFLVAHNDSTSGLRRKYQLSRAAIRFALENRDENNVVRVTPGQLRSAFKRARFIRRLGNPQRMSVLPIDLFVKWRNMLIAPTLTFVTVNTDGGGDYTNLVSAEAGEQDNLVSANEQLTINCSGTTADVAAVVFDGWTTDATRLPIVQGNNDTGIEDTLKYTILVSGVNAIGITSSIDYINFRNIQIQTNYSSGYIIGLWINSGVKVYCSNILIKGSANIGDVRLLQDNSNSDLYIVNSVFNTGLYGIWKGYGPSGTIYAYNNIAYDTKFGYRRNFGAFIAKNCIYQSATAVSPDGYYQVVDGDYNISDIAGDAPGDNSLNETIVTFNNAANGDFSLVAGSAGIDQGADLISEGVTTDIRSVARPQGGAFDIGAFEFPVTNDTNTDTKKHKWLEWIKRKKN